MEELQLEHIAPYLPYKLKCNLMGEIEEDNHGRGQAIGKIFNVNGYEMYNDGEHYLKCSDEEYSHEPPFYDVFPILRPLSDIDKEIYFNGQSVRVSLKLNLVNYGFAGLHPHNEETLKERIRTETLYYKDTQTLFKYHFDVFGLIEKKLAINCNDLN